MINMLWMISCIAAAVTLFYLCDSLLSLVQGRASSTSIVLTYAKTVGPHYKWTNRAWRGVKAGGREAEEKGSWIKRVSCQGHWCGGSDRHLDHVQVVQHGTDVCGQCGDCLWGREKKKKHIPHLILSVIWCQQKKQTQRNVTLIFSPEEKKTRRYDKAKLQKQEKQGTAGNQIISKATRQFLDWRQQWQKDRWWKQEQSYSLNKSDKLPLIQ